MTSEIQHEDISIFFFDFRACKDSNDCMAVLNEGADKIRGVPSKSIYALADVTGVPIYPNFLAEAKRLNQEVYDDKFKISAVLGIDSMPRKLLLMAYNSVAKNKMQAFDTREEALAFLYTGSQP